MWGLSFYWQPPAMKGTFILEASQGLTAEHR
jgi:hypothetical protein